ncbi:MAG TPA: adenylate/guanylate cyclase domain-containing protein [Herbaspirillum sp.]|uniref:adenylate/guanylate cyclase domain-containing protein n=1 Tax=Herbaspirillum sp. TaxID=1890675 RepID=UPI002D26662B|nr:adenylate/guanylate cyclase domain-containing protein [Herbaspirillum sp.]HZG18849.1 adenylate/guanylate cyclase domain-containing protein [Herbaspirillum sp.]
MTLRARLEAEVHAILHNEWDINVGVVVPVAERLRLNTNHAITLENATVLYADLDGSTAMVDKYVWWFSAEVYKMFLRCASQIIRECGGTITAYDGDRVMAIFFGGSKNTSAVTAALQINAAVIDIIQPAILRLYPGADFRLNHVVGIDTSPIRAARVGIHGDNDIVWVGRAANYAAKLTSQPGPATWITADVYNGMSDTVKVSQNVHMWEIHPWPAMGNATIYRCNWKQSFV